MKKSSMLSQLCSSASSAGCVMSAQKLIQLWFISNPIVDAHYVGKQHAMANKQFTLNQLLASVTNFDNNKPRVQLVLFHSMEIGGNTE